MNSPVRDDQDAARRRKRSIVLGLVLGALVVLFYVITIVHMGGDVAKRSF
ncbi:MAG: hypothetical protein AAF441_16785 [Pseudomonadota bacterium]